MSRRRENPRAAGQPPTSTDRAAFLVIDFGVRARDIVSLRAVAPAVMAWFDVTFRPIERARDGDDVLPVEHAEKDGQEWFAKLFTLEELISVVHLRRRLRVYRRTDRGWVRCRLRDFC